MRNFKSRLCLTFSLFCTALFGRDVFILIESLSNHFEAESFLYAFLTAFLGGTIFFSFQELIPRQKSLLKRGWYLYVPLALLNLPLSFFLPVNQIRVLCDTFLLIPIVLVIHSFRKASNHDSLTRERIRYRFAWSGSLIVIALSLAIPALGILAKSAFLIFVFMSFIQRELMTIDEMVARITLFSGIAFMLAVIYSLLVVWVGDKTGLFFFNSLIASFVILVLFDPIRNLSAKITRKFFLRSNSVLENALNSLSTNLVGFVDEQAIAKEVARTLKKFHIEHARLFLLDRDELSYVDATSDTSIPSSHPLIAYMALNKGRPFVLETIQNDRDSFYAPKLRHLCENAIELLREVGADFAIPCLQAGQVLATVVGKTGERSPLSNEQLRLFAPLGRQIALLLRNTNAFAKVRDRDKLLAIGEMAAGLAHEIRNPLGAIKGAAELLQGAVADEKENNEYLQIIIDESQRLSAVLSEFLDYAKPRRATSQTSCSLVQVIEHTINLVSRSKRVPITLHSENAPATLEADPEVLKQVLLNLLLNAAQAVEGKDNPEIQVRVSAQPKLSISVEDNGPGIREDDLPKIFSPFFTTKPKGTGLGLSICERLVQGMGGHIHVESRKPQGSRFLVHLPQEKAKTSRLVPQPMLEYFT